jgi:hypothetical protein
MSNFVNRVMTRSTEAQNTKKAYKKSEQMVGRVTCTDIGCIIMMTKPQQEASLKNLQASSMCLTNNEWMMITHLVVPMTCID